MPANFLQNDLSTVLSSDVFGEATGDVIWEGTPVTDVIFDDMDVEVETGEGLAHIIPQPMLTGKTSDFPGIAEAQSIMVRGETFLVKNFKRDGTGMIEIYLTRDLPST